MPIYKNVIQNISREDCAIQLTKQLYVDGTISLEVFEDLIEKILLGDTCAPNNYIHNWGTELELK